MTVLFHHDPYHTDDELEALLVEAQQQCETVGDDVCLAHEGMTIAIDRDGRQLRLTPRRPSRRRSVAAPGFRSRSHRPR